MMEGMEEVEEEEEEDQGIIWRAGGIDGRVRKVGGRGGEGNRPIDVAVEHYVFPGRM